MQKIMPQLRSSNVDSDEEAREAVKTIIRVIPSEWNAVTVPMLAPLESFFREKIAVFGKDGRILLEKISGKAV